MNTIVKAFYILSLVICNSANADIISSKIVSETMYNLPVELNSETVKMSKADYDTPVLKVLIPALAEVTLLNHRNFRENAPCVATYESKNPDDVLQNNPGTEVVPTKITLKREYHTTDKPNTCEVRLVESIEVPIRGLPFVHDRSTSLGKRNIGDCI